jgi:hypothetical protein
MVPNPFIGTCVTNRIVPNGMFCGCACGTVWVTGAPTSEPDPVPSKYVVNGPLDPVVLLTFTEACAVDDPLLFVAVSVYCVVAAGETVVLVPVTGPMPEMDRLVSPETTHESVDIPPEAIVPGLAVKLWIVGTEPVTGVTVTVTSATTAPLGLMAVSSYVVVCVGETLALVPETTPMPVMTNSVAFVTLQLNVALFPAVIVMGAAVKDAMTGSDGAGSTVIVTCAVAGLPVPDAESV